MQEAFPMEKIFIPPWSIFIGRGDLTHAGAAFKDGPLAEIERRNREKEFPREGVLF